MGGWRHSRAPRGGPVRQADPHLSPWSDGRSHAPSACVLSRTGRVTRLRLVCFGALGTGSCSSGYPDCLSTPTAGCEPPGPPPYGLESMRAEDVAQHGRGRKADNAPRTPVSKKPSIPGRIRCPGRWAAARIAAGQRGSQRPAFMARSGCSDDRVSKNCREKLADGEKCAISIEGVLRLQRPM